MGKSIVTILIVCLMLTSCGIQKEESLTFVYDTEQYQTYKRLERLAASSADNSKALYMENIVQREIQYSVYEVSDLKVLIEQGDADITNYLLYINGEYLTTIPFRNHSRVIEEVTIYYIDITGDLKHDVVMFCQPPAGTSTSPYWSYAYDVYNKRKISFFDEVSGELTESQKEQLMKILDNDEEFKELFSEYCGLGGSGAPRPYVDMFGKIYYEMAVWGENSYTDAIGSILVMLVYNKEENCFDVNAVLYMPLYVEVYFDR